MSNPFKPGDEVEVVPTDFAPVASLPVGSRFKILDVDNAWVLVHTGIRGREWFFHGRFARVATTSDPGPHTTHLLPAGSAARKAVPLYRALVGYFGAALAGLARHCMRSNEKHNAGQEMHWSRDNSADHPDALMRHLWELDQDFGHGKGYDHDGNPTVDSIVWRACAISQLWYEQQGLAPRAFLARYGKDGQR